MSKKMSKNITVASLRDILRGSNQSRLPRSKSKDKISLKKSIDNFRFLSPSTSFANL